MRAVQLNIPLGYKIEEEKTVLSVEQARRLLLTRKQKKYTCAQRDDCMVELTRHFIKCPYCSHKVGLYARELKRAFNLDAYSDYRVEKNVVLDWTSQQLSIFQDAREPLLLSRAVKVCTDLTCPSCKNTMHNTDKTRLVEIKHEKNKIYVRTEILDILELFALPCLTQGEVTVEFPLFEVSCFNFRNGHSYIRLETKRGKCLAVRDLTSDKYAWTSGTVYSVITHNKYVKRILRDMFSDEWKSKIPFFSSELGANELRMLTAFIGYKREFYSSIPFDKGSLGVEGSFRTLSNKMRHAEEVISLYESSRLPNMKSVKRTMFDNAGLFFYLVECERLWELFHDPNYFVSLLKDGGIYKILSELHMRPAIYDFFADYLKTGSKKKLMNLIHKSWSALSRYAVNYSSMSSYMRKAEQVRWKEGGRCNAVCHFPRFAIPMCRPNDEIHNCTIDEFEFSWLRTSADYEEAGNALNNCLTEWSIYDYPVVCVRKGGKIIAAIEMRGDFAYQALTYNNQSLAGIPGLLEAYKKWHSKNNLSDSYHPLPGRIYDEDLDEDEFPF